MQMPPVSADEVAVLIVAMACQDVTNMQLCVEDSLVFEGLARRIWALRLRLWQPGMGHLRAGNPFC